MNTLIAPSSSYLGNTGSKLRLKGLSQKFSVAKVVPAEIYAHHLFVVSILTKIMPINTIGIGMR
ncbi:MAG: hypothetical protein R3Y11_08760 [Pseudomonadota bacterium]